MLCDWKPEIDAGDFIVLIVDFDQIDNPEVEMQASYASLMHKTVLAMIENPGEPAKYMTELPGFMYENFERDDVMSFKSGMSRLILRHKELADIKNAPKIKFLCFSGCIDCDRIMREGV
jgi:hypothetical protein